ncbi:hypothetical protein WJX77_001363 [Trebouxia sp. C0004]
MCLEALAMQQGLTARLEAENAFRKSLLFKPLPILLDKAQLCMHACSSYTDDKSLFYNMYDDSSNLWMDLLESSTPGTMTSQH